MKSRLKMIESIYNIKPADIIARIALDKADGNLEVDDSVKPPTVNQTASPK